MHSDDALRSDEAVNFFEESLREQGLESVQVAHQTSVESFLDEFYIRKQINREEQLSYKTTVDITTDIHNRDVVRKRLTLEAERVAEEFKQKLITTFEWDDRRVEVCPYDGGWARCSECGTRVDAPKAEYLVTDGCELSDPTPVHRDMTHELENMDDHQEILFQLYLIGILREQCEPHCRNSKYTESKDLNTISYNV
jgi:hypothetical protein